ncbi:winged helix-turn-helix transcriptional regulator [Salininema proteolyticum]|uniref:winged helix-turn-helix transcriptional regulator n=1 Tax=Salininema proteolyticum TaxID=1607685 RepID=UPI00362765D8
MRRSRCTRRCARRPRSQGRKRVPRRRRAFGSRRFSEPRVPLRGVSAKVLTQSLRGLEQATLVNRRELSDTHVEYGLAELGRSMVPIVDNACEWTRNHWLEQLEVSEGYRVGAQARLRGAHCQGTSVTRCGTVLR